MNQEPETVETAEAPATEARYTMAMVFTCPADICGHTHAMVDPKLVGAAFNGAHVKLKCGKCGLELLCRPAWESKEQPRIITPGMGPNRHARRAAETIARLQR
jgi:hypothetical protein